MYARDMPQYPANTFNGRGNSQTSPNSNAFPTAVQRQQQMRQLRNFSHSQRNFGMNRQPNAQMRNPYIQSMNHQQMQRNMQIQHAKRNNTMQPQQFTQSRIQNSYHNMRNPAAVFQMTMQNESRSQMNMAQYIASQQGRYGNNGIASPPSLPPLPPPPPMEDELLELKSQFIPRRAVSKDNKVPSHLKLIHTKYKEVVKTKDVCKFLKECLLKEVLFQGMDGSMINDLVKAMYRVDCPKGECIVRQNECGNTYFVIQSGSFDIIHQEIEDAPKNILGKVLPGKSFGSGSLLYATPRAATLKATKACVVWALDKTEFQEKRQRQHKKLVRLDKKRKFKINEVNDQTSNIVSQLRVFGYNEIDIKRALNNVIDKNDINSIIEYIDKNDSFAPEMDNEVKEMNGTTQQFYNFLKQHRLEQFFEKFQENRCNDVRDIEYLIQDEEFLKNEIGLKSIELKRFVGECKKLKEEMDAFQQSNLIPILLVDKLSKCGIITMKILCREVQHKLDLKNKFNIADKKQCTLLWNVIQLQLQPQINNNDYAAAAIDREGVRNNNNNYGHVLDTAQ
eukprot:917681_1